MRMNDRTYDFLKWLCLIVLPALATLYATVGKLWQLPYADVIPATINAVATFIGVCIGVSTLNYNKDTIGFTDGTGSDPVDDTYEDAPEELTDEEKQAEQVEEQ